MIVLLSLIGFLRMGDVAEAGSFMDFLKAIGNSIAHPQKKSKARTKSTKQPGSKDVASTKPTLSLSSSPPDEDTGRAASPSPAAERAKADVAYAIPVPGKQGF